MTNIDETKSETGSAAPSPNPIAAAAAQVSSLMVVVISSMISIIIVMVGYLAYTQLAPKPVKFAMADIAEVVQIKELIVTTSVSKPGTTDLDRAKAFDEIGNFGARLESALAEMQNECGCIILVRAAVIKGVEDMTPALKEKVGLGGISRDMAVAAFTGRGGLDKPVLDKSGGN